MHLIPKTFYKLFPNLLFSSLNKYLTLERVSPMYPAKKSLDIFLFTTTSLIAGLKVLPVKKQKGYLEQMLIFLHEMNTVADSRS